MQAKGLSNESVGGAPSATRRQRSVQPTQEAVSVTVQCRNNAVGRPERSVCFEGKTRAVTTEMIRFRSIQTTPGIPIRSGFHGFGLMRGGRCQWRPGRFKFWRRARWDGRPVCFCCDRGVSDGWRVHRDGQWHHHGRGLASRSGALFSAAARQSRLGAASRRGKR